MEVLWVVYRVTTTVPTYIDIIYIDGTTDKDDKAEHTKSKPEFRLRQTPSGDVEDNIHHLNQNLKLY
jgi:hypothetical protein